MAAVVVRRGVAGLAGRFNDVVVGVPASSPVHRPALVFLPGDLQDLAEEMNGRGQERWRSE